MLVIDRLAQMHQREYATITNSGTTALVLGLWALGLTNKRIAIPNNACFSVPLAVYLSGNEPVWIDIEKETMGISIEDLRTSYQVNVYDAVIVIHSYGTLCDIVNISDFCREKDIPLIEDCAVALGAKDVGSYGDLSILSFGVGKILDNGGDGAVLTNDSELMESVRFLQYALPRAGSSRYSNMRKVSHLHTALYNNYYWTDWHRLSVFRDIVLRCSFDYLAIDDYFGIDYFSLEKKLDRLEENLKFRQDNWMLLDRELIEYVNLIFPSNWVYSVDWRFNFLVEPEQQQPLLNRLHEKQFNASSWYPPSDIFWRERSRNDLSPTPNTDWVGDRIINLWVDNSVDAKYLMSVSEEVKRFIDGYK